MEHGKAHNKSQENLHEHQESNNHKSSNHSSSNNIPQKLHESQSFNYGSNKKVERLFTNERMNTNDNHITDEGRVKKSHHHNHGHSHHGHHKSHHHDNDSEHLLGAKKLDKVTKDPLKFFEAEVAEDFYALTWCALKKEIWEGKEVYGVPIFLTPRNYLQLKLEFIMFAVLISLTVFIMLYQTFTTKTFQIVSWRLEILRILIVGFAQRLLFPEIHKGTTKFRYAITNPDEFCSPIFAAFVPFWQILMSGVSYCLIVIFMCMSDEALPLVMHFAEVAILIELDDWMGEMIVKEYPDEGEKPDDVCADNLNEEIGLHMKLALVKEDLHIINDLNVEFSNVIMRCMSSFVSNFPFFLLPFISTLGFEYLLKYYQPSMVHVITVGGNLDMHKKLE